MIYEYNNFDLAQLGDLSVSQKRTYEGGESPQRARVTHTVTVELFERTYQDNYALIQQAIAALQLQQAPLTWTNDVSGDTYVDQTVTLEDIELPEDWGQYHATLKLTLFYYEQDLVTQNLPLTFTATAPSGATTGTPSQPISLQNVIKWKEGGTTEYYSPLHSQRKLQQGKLQVTGYILGDPTLPLEGRRAALIQQEQALKAQMTAAQGVLTYGATDNLVFQNTVRIMEWDADVDQLANKIDYNFSAQYTLFPDEDNYALAEFTTELSDPNPNAGELFLTIAGKVTASSQATAETKMQAIIATALGQYQFTTSQKINFRATPATVIADTDGTTFLELSFSTQWRTWSKNNQQATFLRSGKTGAPVSFPNVQRWNLNYSAKRFDDLRSQRQYAGGAIDAAGTIAVDRNLSLATRRTQLLAQQQAMLAEANNADGRLNYGSWSQTVRIENLKADINQTDTGIDWSFTARWTLFPNETGYATSDYTSDYETNLETGEATLALEGKIAAPSEALALAQLANLRTTLLGIYGFTLNQQLTTKVQSRRIFANGDHTSTLGAVEAPDGTSFIETSFAETYRQRAANILSDTLAIAQKTDTATNLTTVTYSGTVTASGDMDAAYAIALLRAQTLGANKQGSLGPNAFLKTSEITQDRRRTTSGNTPEFVKLTFNYEYQGKLAPGMAYAEITTQTAQNAFDTDTTTVSGSVAASDAITAQTLYQQLRATYNAMLVHNETINTAVCLPQNSSAAAITGWTQQFMKLDFSFQMYATKPAGRVAYKYGITVSKDFLKLELVTRLTGEIYAFNGMAARAALSALLSTITGAQIAEELEEEREYMSDLNLKLNANVFVKLNFTETYTAALTGITGVLEMELMETVKYSGTRWITQPLPFNDNGGGGVSVMQPAGLEAGGRSIKGSITAPDMATASAWAKSQRSLLQGPYIQPEEWEWDYEFVPRIAGIVGGTINPQASNNVRMFKLDFTFAEILPSAAPPS